MSSSIESLLSTLRAEVARLTPGERLLSSRALVSRYGVGPVTVARAIARLASEGIVVTRPGIGTFVAARRPRVTSDDSDTSWQAVALGDRSIDARAVIAAFRPPLPNTIALTGGYLHPALQATGVLTGALTRAARRPDAWDRAPTMGLAPLRALIARFVGADVTPDNVLITSSGQTALTTAVRAIAAPGSPVLVETPTYPGALAALRAAGLRPVPVPMDEGGVLPDLLCDAFTSSGARAFYCQPTFHNPTGAVLATDRRTAVLDVARAHGAFVIEDDFARFLGHGGRVPRPLIAEDSDGTVVYLTSLTKPAAPSLRIGALIARGPVMERLRAMRFVDDFFVARPLQEAAIELLSAPAWERHVRTLGAELLARRTALITALDRETPEWIVTRVPTGGLHLWVKLPTADAELAERAAAFGVAVGAGREFFPAEEPGPYLRLSFAAAANVDELTEGVRCLAEARLHIKRSSHSED